MVFTGMEVYGMYLFQCDIMLILCVILARKNHFLFAGITIDGIYVKQILKHVLHNKHQLCMNFTDMKMYLK